VLDFGIAKFDDGVSSATRTGAMMGTAYYMSPEQIVGSKSVDHRTDVWALGVVAYELLTGVRPFVGDTLGALALAIHSTTPAPPTSIEPTLPPAIDAWFARACARDVAMRFQSVKELARGLAELLGEARGGFSSSASSGVSSGVSARASSGASTTTGAPAEGALAAMQLARPLTTTTGHSAGPIASKPPTTSRAPFVVAGVLAVAAIGGALILFGRGASTPITPAPTSGSTAGPSADPPEPTTSKSKGEGAATSTASTTSATAAVSSQPTASKKPPGAATKPTTSASSVPATKKKPTTPPPTTSTDEPPIY